MAILLNRSQDMHTTVSQDKPISKVNIPDEQKLLCLYFKHNGETPIPQIEIYSKQVALLLKQWHSAIAEIKTKQQGHIMIPTPAFFCNIKFVTLYVSSYCIFVDFSDILLACPGAPRGWFIHNKKLGMKLSLP